MVKEMFIDMPLISTTIKILLSLVIIFALLVFMVAMVYLAIVICGQIQEAWRDWQRISSRGQSQALTEKGEKQRTTSVDYFEV